MEKYLSVCGFASEFNQVTFNVAIDSNKKQIKESVENIFKVKVKNVNGITENLNIGNLNFKKATVTLRHGQTIDMDAISHVTYDTVVISIDMSTIIHKPNGVYKWSSTDSESRFKMHVRHKRTNRKLKALGWTKDAITYEFNSDGFRDKEFESGGICFFGCSFGYGVGVKAEDRFSNIIQNALGIRCNNLCIPASGSDTTARILPYWIEKLKPIMVVNHFLFPARREIVNDDSTISLWFPRNVKDRYNSWSSRHMPRKKFGHLIQDDAVKKFTQKNISTIQQCCNNKNIAYIESNDFINDSLGRDLDHPGTKTHIEIAKTFLTTIKQN